ncbi:MAG: M1 family aminopeptidase [Bacteroidota bacterium]|nr:M1 family aminopeptidase [Bacteroidota bacterium]
MLKLFPVFTVEQIRSKGKEIGYSQKKEILSIKEFEYDSIITFAIRYSGRFQNRTEFTELTAEHAILRSEEILPIGPSAFQFVRLTISVPSNWETIAVGRLLSKDSTTESAIFVFEFDKPLPTLGWICAGKFWRKDVQHQDYSVSAFLYEDDSSSAESILLRSRDVLSFYSEKFIPYRFPGFSIVEVDNWVAGNNVLAIASPSFIMVKKDAFTTIDRFNQIQSILAHEIAHQWWPLSIFIQEEDAAFLSEGMCEYSSHIFNETFGTMTQRDSLRDHPLLRPLLLRVQQGKDVPLRKKADLRATPTQYLKAGYVHNMLRQMMGKDKFLELYHEFAVRYNEKRASLEDFQYLAEKIYGQSLSWFFDQWLTKKGVPRLRIYNVKSIPKENNWLTRGRVRMVGYEQYSTFVDVAAELPNGEATTRIFVGTDSLGKYLNDVPFEIITSEKPKRVCLDPLFNILKVQKLPAKLTDLREPADGIMIVGTIQHYEQLLQLAQRDSKEMEKGGWAIRIKPDTSVSLFDLQSDRVIIYGKDSENRIAAEQKTKFPLGFINDSIMVKGEMLYDSSLALIQIIDNPFAAQGMMIWIAPLSENSVPELFPYDASWILLKGKEEISSGTWEVKDEDLVVEIK